jgi:hypothetical protein
MIQNPFALLEPFGEVDVSLFTKTDQIKSDDATAAMLGDAPYVSAEQVHGTRTIRVSAALHATEQADGLVTDHQNLWLFTRFADCQGFALYAPQSRVIGVLHAGWRGLTAGAIPAFFEVLEREWGIAPRETWVVAGPSLCTEHAEFTDPVRELPSLDPKFFHGRHVDLRGAADEQFFRLGVPRDHFERSRDCTFCRSDLYWSYRGGDRAAVQDRFRNVLAARLCPVLE